MRFWDTSAVVPLLVDEPSTRLSRRLLEQDRAMAVWALTRTEAFSRTASAAIILSAVMRSSNLFQRETKFAKGYARCAAWMSELVSKQ